MADDQAATVRTITAYRGVITGLVAEHRGRVVDAPGDNVLAEFPTARDAVDAAIEIQRVLYARNLGLPENRRMRFRIGAHLGDITVEGERVYGDGVNVAARLEALAEPGGICVSGVVKEQLSQRTDVAWEDLGEQTLKNIPVSVKAFRLRYEGQLSVPKAVPTARGGGSRWPILALAPWVLAVVLAAVVVSTIFEVPATPTVPAAAVSRFSIPLPTGARIGIPAPGGNFDYSGLIAISPTGARLVYAVQDEQYQSQLFVREMDDFNSRPLRGTEDSRGPFFSPDGTRVGFLADGKIQIVALSGGSPQVVCQVDRVVSFDATWSPDGETIVFSTDDGLWRVPASGGAAEQLTAPDSAKGEVGHHAPRFTLDGRGVLFTVSITPATHLALLSMAARTWDVLVPDAAQAIQVADSRIVFARSGELLTASYDNQSGKIVGAAVPVLQGLHTGPGLGGVVLTHFDIAADGTLVFVPRAASAVSSELVWVDRGGVETVITGGSGAWVHPRLSPDGQRISVDIHSSDGMRDLYVYEIARGQLRQLTKTGITWESEWRPDGKRIATMSGAPAGQWSPFWIESDFSGPPELLYRARHSIPTDWLPDGETLLLYDLIDDGIWTFVPGSSAEPELLMRSDSRERFPMLSPDGEWIAYVADESGRREVFVQSFPDLGPKYQVSIAGGGEPVWSPDGSELFFREGGEMFVVEVSLESEPRIGRPRVLFASTLR